MHLLKHKIDGILKYKDKHKLLTYFICYTILFIIMSILVFCYFFFYRKSFVFTVDGSVQHVNSLAYFGEYLRGIVVELFKTHKLVIPMWDMNMGYGSDIITTLHYYTIGDPLSLFAVFVPKEYTEILYTLLILLRLYLAGISFSCYCFFHKNNRFPTILGALAFCFCGYSLFAGIRHPYFLNPMIYLPFILIGIDKVLKKEKPYIFIISTALAAISNFYFFYMICIFMFIYAVFRYFILFRKIAIKELIIWLSKFIAFFAIGIGMSCFILLPVVISLFSTNRMEAKNYVPLFYNKNYYESFLTAFLAGKQTGYWSVMGYTPIILVSIFSLFVKKKNTQLKIGILMLTTFLCIPFIGHVINGFSYVSNRWIWVYAMLNSYILVKSVPDLLTLNRKEKYKLMLILAVYVGLCLISLKARSVLGYGGVLILIMTAVFIVSSDEIFIKPFIRKGVLLFSTCIGIVWSSYSLYSINMTDYTKSYLGLMEWKNYMLKNHPSDIVKNLEDDSIFRYDQYGTGEIYNTGIQQKLNSTSFYYSLALGSISEYFDEIYLNNPLEQRYNNLDGRMILDTLASVKYFLIKDGTEHFLPYNYNVEKVQTATIKGKNYSVYQGTNTLPLGYTFDAYIPRDKYEMLSVTEKQQSILQGCVLEESTFSEKNPIFNDVVLEYEVIAETGAKVVNNKIEITKKNATVTLKFDGLKNSETYFIIENLTIRGIHPLHLYTEKQWNKLSTYNQRKVELNNKYWSEPASYKISLALEIVKKTLTMHTNRYNFYAGKHDFMCNMGYNENAATEIVLTFPTIGIYTFDDLRVVCQPMQEMNGYIDALKEDVLQDVEITTNIIEGNITLRNPKILILSIPYSKGWSVTVDGDKRELKQANTMFMAVELDAGIHEIKFRYVTPYIRYGIFISIGSCLVFLFIILYNKKYYKNVLTN